MPKNKDATRADIVIRRQRAMELRAKGLSLRAVAEVMRKEFKIATYDRRSLPSTPK
jgi:hypothetical protein